MGVIREYMCDRSSGTRHAIVIDPADQTPEVAANRAMAAVNALGSSSTVQPDTLICSNKQVPLDLIKTSKHTFAKIRLPLWS